MPRRLSKTDQAFFSSLGLLVAGFVLLFVGGLGIFSLKFWEMTQQPKVIPLTLQQKIETKSFSQISDEEWKQLLPLSQYKILREGGTELAFTGKYLHEKRSGTYVTADCNIPVFRSEQKYDSGTGWPSFWAPANEEIIELREDKTYGITRIEVIEKTCGSHLGHVFEDGPEPSGKRFCINSEALKFIPDP